MQPLNSLLLHFRKLLLNLPTFSTLSNISLFPPLPLPLFLSKGGEIQGRRRLLLCNKKSPSLLLPWIFHLHSLVPPTFPSVTCQSHFQVKYQYIAPSFHI